MRWPGVVSTTLQLVAGGVMVQLSTPSPTLMVPPGVPAPGGDSPKATLAVTLSPGWEWPEVERASVVAALPTVWATLLMPERKRAGLSLEKFALTVLLPAVAFASGQLPSPLTSTMPQLWPSPSSTSTLPGGRPTLPRTDTFTA